MITKLKIYSDSESPSKIKQKRFFSQKMKKKKFDMGFGVTIWRKNFFCLIFDVDQEKHIFNSFGDIL